MHSWRNFSLGLLLAGAALAADPAPAKTAKPAKAPAPAPVQTVPMGAGAAGNLKSIGLLLPVGRSSDHVVIPRVNPDGTPASMTQLGKITRTGENELTVEKAVLQTFGRNSQDGMTVELRTGIFYLDTGLLKSTTPAKITGGSFVITGETLLFDTQRRIGRVDGRCTMILESPEKPAVP